MKRNEARKEEGEPDKICFDLVEDDDIKPEKEEQKKKESQENVGHGKDTLSTESLSWSCCTPSASSASSR